MCIELYKYTKITFFIYIYVFSIAIYVAIYGRISWIFSKKTRLFRACVFFGWYFQVVSPPSPLALRQRRVERFIYRVIFSKQVGVGTSWGTIADSPIPTNLAALGEMSGFRWFSQFPSRLGGSPMFWRIPEKRVNVVRIFNMFIWGFLKKIGVMGL